MLRNTVTVVYQARPFSHCTGSYGWSKARPSLNSVCPTHNFLCGKRLDTLGNMHGICTPLAKAQLSYGGFCGICYQSGAQNTAKHFKPV